MRELVLVKLGGGAITDKHSLCEANDVALDALTGALAQVWKKGIDLIVVHGAGSFGHLRCRAWQLQRGRALDAAGAAALPLDGNGLDCASQDAAVSRVREDLLTLHAKVLASLNRHGVPTRSRAPHELGILGTGMKLEADLASLFIGRLAPERFVDVTLGDVVDCRSPQDFGVLSGDDLMARLALDLPGVTRAVFAVEGVDGLLRAPPRDGEPQQLVPEWHPDDPLPGTQHDDTVDVTGGIFLKVNRAAEMARHGVTTKLVRAVADRCLAACAGDNACPGTLVCLPGANVAEEASTSS
ncbi:Hypothetical Protein FCC1311_090202 [Hondaea fermentalgiana]|uniref:Aspartate/glutamate/uridylate kinase domain-containing protein n=1 Tax=Hondaea fermentalgiana TaxID=2315210 RepID=A0A2R5GQA2_9STRA|nr:Hypothetical Protein FCC1311_090202 [Hondaea fermentalgiana]|eukprot:GBG32795.1 Hypothetical Protein FCC1311_090202 [Hondaea fermentalgiana]